MADTARNLYRTRHSTPEQAHGRRGEDLAHRYLRCRGLTVVARNFRPRSASGEIDLVAWDGDTLVFVEVKTRGTADFGEPSRAVDSDKEKEVRRAAAEYLRRAGRPDGPARADIVSIVLTSPPSIDWIKDAFPLSRKL